MSINNAHIPDDLMNAVSMVAQSEGKTADELLAEAARRYLAHKELNELVERGRSYSERENRKPSDVLRLIQESRDEQPGQ